MNGMNERSRSVSVGCALTFCLAVGLAAACGEGRAGTSSAGEHDSAVPPPSLQSGPDAAPEQAVDATVPSSPATGFRIGGAGLDFGKDVAVDPRDGTVYVTGYFTQTVDLDPGPGVATVTAPNPTVFVAKYRANGELVKAVTFGGAGPNMPHSIRVDAAGRVLVGGYFSGSPDFDPGPGVVSRTSAGGRDGFLLQLGSDLELGWVATYGAAGDDEIADIAVSANGAVSAIGTFTGPIDVDWGPGETVLVPVGPSDAFVATYSAGGDLLRSFALGGPTGSRAGFAIASDADGGVAISGTFDGRFDCDPGPGVREIVSSPGGRADVYVARFDSQGGQVHCSVLSGSGADLVPPGGLDISADGSVVLAGRFQGRLDLPTGAGTLTSAGGDDLFVARLGPTGAVDFAVRGGGSGNDSLHRARFTPSGGVVVGGWFRGVSTIVGTDGTRATVTAAAPTGTASDLLVFGLDRSGRVVSSWHAGSGSVEEDPGIESNTMVAGLALGVAGEVLVTGRFYGTLALGGSSLTSAGRNDVFVARLRGFI